MFRAAEVYGGIPTPLLEEPDLVVAMGRALKDDLVLVDSYACTDVEVLRCPIIAAGGLDDRLVSRSELEAWGAYTKVAFTCAQFDGDHFYLRGAGQQALLATMEQICRSAGAR
jgi:surfactin synthase thioesterase subunit